MSHLMKMPNTARNHDESRSAVCLLCLGKSKEMRTINVNIQAIIEEYFVQGYDPNDSRLPNALCSVCRKITQEYAAGDFSRSIELFDYSAVGSAPPITRSSPSCSCIVCVKARNNIRPKTCSRQGRPPSTYKSKDCAILKKIPVRLCQFCLTVVSRGKGHNCSSSTRLQNITNLAAAISPKESEKVASAILKDKSSKEVSPSLSLATSSGRPVRVAVFPPLYEKSQQVLSAEYLSKIQLDLNLSTNETNKLASHIRIATKDRTSVEAHSREKLKIFNHSLDKFFAVEEMEFVHGSTQTRKSIVYCNHVDNMIQYIIQKRNMNSDDQDVHFKISIDGGGGFIKMCLSISEEKFVEMSTRIRFSDGLPSKSLKNTGVKRIFILAIAPDVQENYSNILKIWHKLQLTWIPLTQNSMQSPMVTVATDLKVANILLGLMSHGSTHPCCWCDVRKSNLNSKGDLRTLANIREKFWAWHESGSDIKHAKEYGNVVHLPLLNGDPDDKVITLLPPPELHLLTGPVNTIFNSLMKEWPAAIGWAVKCHVQRDAIHGGSFNGNSCNELLSKIDLLRSMAPLRCLKYVECLSAFKNVVKSCYGHKLDLNYSDFIKKFQTSFLDLEISVTPKVHAIFFHIDDFLRDKNEGLARWSEQTSEAVHSDFKLTWNKYKVSLISPNYNEKLLRAVCDYNSKHL